MTETPVSALLLVSGLLAGAIGMATLHEAISEERSTRPSAADTLPRRPPDHELQSTIAQRLNSHDQLGQRQIDVEVKEGHVTLRGMVASEFEKTHAFFLATVPGVGEIDNLIQVRGHERSEDMSTKEQSK